MNFDRFRNSTRVILGGSGGQKKTWIVFVLLLAILLVATSVLAQDKTPAGSEEFDTKEAIRKVNAVLATGGGTVNDGCMLDVYNAYDSGGGGGLNCTANDISIAAVTNHVASPAYSARRIAFCSLIHSIMCCSC